MDLSIRYLRIFADCLHVGQVSCSIFFSLQFVKDFSNLSDLYLN